MTSPVDPSNPSADASPTEPVPAVPTFEPAPNPVPTFEPATSAVPPPAVTAGPAVTTAPAKAARKGGVSILNVALGVAVLVATAGVAFAVGRTTAPAAASSETAITAPGGGRFFVNGEPQRQLRSQRRPGRPGNGNGNGRFGLGAAPTIEGTVDSITADAITIRTADGNTITIGLDSSTTYHQQAAATRLGRAAREDRQGAARGRLPARRQRQRERERQQRERQRERQRQRLDQPRQRRRRDRRSLIEDPRSPCTCSWSRTTSGWPAP